MSKTNETSKLDHATPKDRLDDTELKAVTGGMDLKGASDAMTQRAQQCGQNDPAQMFQQIMQQLTQGG